MTDVEAKEAFVNRKLMNSKLKLAISKKLTNKGLSNKI